MSAEKVGGLLPCGADSLTLGNLLEQSCKVGRLNYLEVFVARGVLQPTNYGSCVEKSDALLLEQQLNLVSAEGAMLLVNKMMLVAKEANAENSPHVVDEVRIKEFHRPTLPCRREAAEHQQSTPLRQEGAQGMEFGCSSYFLHFCSFTRYTTTGKWSLKPSSHTPPAVVRFGEPLYLPSFWKR